MNTQTRITPRLIVNNAAAAIELYCEVFGAQVLERFADAKRGGRIVHCGLSIGDSLISLADSDSQYGNESPEALNGSPVLLTIEVPDAQKVGQRLENAGGTVIIPIEDRFYGKREGRLRDPFGHLWIISQTIEKLSSEQIMQRMGE